MNTWNPLVSKIAENIGLYYNEEKLSGLDATDNLEQAREFLIMPEEAEDVL